MRGASEQPGTSHASLPSRSLAYHFGEALPGSTPVLALHRPLGGQGIAVSGVGPRAGLTGVTMLCQLLAGRNLFFNAQGASATATN